jgi:hypothetical protein
MSNMILRPDGTPDWRAMTEAANLNPPAASPQQLIAEPTIVLVLIFVPPY